MTQLPETGAQVGTPAGVEQKVSWLELFFDLIFVVAFDQLSKRLGDSHTLENIGAFGIMFVAIWWAWSTNATFAARYGNESRAYRWGTLLELVGMGLIALSLRGDLKETGIYFALGYGFNRLLHAGQHLWITRRAPETVAFSRRIALVSGVAAALWALSAFLPGGSAWQVGLWCFALLIDVVTPVLVRDRNRSALPHEGHLPERVGLLQIIAMGGIVNEIVGGGRKQALSWMTLWPAFLSMATVVALWRLYFDQTHALPLLSARVEGREGRMLAWLYGHLPFTLSLVVLGVGIGHGLSSADSHEVAVQQQFVVWSLVIAFVSLTFLRLVTLRVARLPLLDRSGFALIVGALALAALAFVDLDTKRLDLLVVVVCLAVASTVATDPVTHRLGQLEEHVAEHLEAQAADAQDEAKDED